MSLLPHVHTPPIPHLSPEVCVVVLSLCPNTAPPAAVIWPHPSTLEEESQSLITLPPSLHSEQTIHIILHMYEKNLALDNIYSVPTHHSEHCGRSVQDFCWYVFNGCPTNRKRQNVYDRYPGHESGEKRKRCLAWVMGVCPYLLTAPTKLHRHPYHLRAHTVTEKHDSVM